MYHKSYDELLQSKQYTPEEIASASLIVHPKVLDRYGLVADQIAHIFQEWSNFTSLKNPIVDIENNEYRDSEGFYMAQRIANTNIKKMIAFCSIAHGLSKKVAYRYKELLDNDPHHKIDYMRSAVQQKFDKNPNLKNILTTTNNREIIEYTYRWDIFFGISHRDNTGSNILGKLLMEYRDNHK